MRNNSSRRLTGLCTALRLLVAMLAAPVPLSHAIAQDPPAAPADGTVTIQDLEVPVSNLLSPEGAAYLRHLIVDKPFGGGPGPGDIAGQRAHQDKIMNRFLDPMRRRYSVKVEERKIAGRIVDVVIPTAGIAPENRGRVLLNLHGGGFLTGARTAALVESVPVAALMRVKVISIDYRMAPEHRFPAASEDVAAVYREVLKEFKPANIGIYGCSAGGMLAGQAVAWFDKSGLPMPGAIGVLCASVGALVAGDAAYLSGPLNGNSRPAASARSRRPSGPTMQYFENVDTSNALAYPLASPELLAKFPPTLLITGTRSFEFSAAAHSNNQLNKAGIDARLHVWDGMFHGFIYNSELPEAREAYDVIVKFFRSNLGKSD